MTPQEYRDALAELGLTITGAGPALGVTPRASQKWARLDGPGPTETAAKLVRMMVELRRLDGGKSYTATVKRSGAEPRTIDAGSTLWQATDIADAEFANEDPKSTIVITNNDGVPVTYRRIADNDWSPIPWR